MRPLCHFCVVPAAALSFALCVATPGFAAQTAEPAVVAPPPAVVPRSPAVTPAATPALPPGDAGRIVIPESFDQHFLVFQASRQIGIEVDRSRLDLSSGERSVVQTVDRQTAFSAGGGTMQKTYHLSWRRTAAGFPLVVSRIVEEADSRVVLDAFWQADQQRFVYRISDESGTHTGSFAVTHPEATVLELDGVILRGAGELKAGGSLERYVLRLDPPAIGLGRERAKVIKVDAGPKGRGVVYTLEISDASAPDGSPAPNAPLPRTLIVNELGHPLQTLDFPIRHLAVRPDLAVMPATPPEFSNSLKVRPANPKQPPPATVPGVDRLDRAFLVLSAPILEALHSAAYQDVAVTKDQDRMVAVVKLRSVRADGRTPMEWLSAAQRAQFLAPTSQIQSDQRDIEARARSIEDAVLKAYARRAAAAGRPATAMPAAERDYALAVGIERWVYSNLEKTAAGPADASALHALYYREGDCTEHSNLAVALARSRGLPARICRGLVLEDGELTAHQWAEMFIRDTGGPAPLPPPAADNGSGPAPECGLWLPVDPTLDRVGVPAAYVLLGHDEAGLDNTLLSLMLDGDATWMSGAAQVDQPAATTQGGR